MKNNYSKENRFDGVYRGYVIYNEDPLNRGRIKIFVPGVYSSKYMDNYDVLPWALPAMSIFGGGSTNALKEGVLNKEVGYSSVPHMGNVSTGSQVFVFFENGDINHPVYFAVAQSGEGWLSEHPNQHVFNSDNVRIRIDESIYNEETKKWDTDEKSTCKFDSYTENIPELGKKQLELDCEKNKWKFSNGKVEQLETRIDIEVKADNINAVNLNIHGNVNMHIDGNWFIEHIGNKYEYHKGEHYIKHDGSTYIEHNGIYKNIQEGNRTYIQTGKYNYIQTGDALITRTGELFEKINGAVNKEYDAKYDLTIGGKTDEIYNDDRTINVKGNYSKTITKNQTVEVMGNIEVTTYGWMQNIADENISFTTKNGNFTVKTEGLFELVDDNNIITSEGFNNLGNRGNIQFISTFGNINLQCIKNDDVADFSKKTMVIPWNPGFLAEIEKNIAMFPTFTKEMATSKGLDFPTDILDFAGFVSFFKSLPNLLIYDGLPVFLPTKMIVQNPNIPSPENTDDLSWIPNFRSEVTDWRSGDNEMYWKLPGRMMGNINIETWSGDINIKTESELGCAGNINIVASEKTGTLPGYQIGCVNIKNSAEKRIYPDPRDLFFDSDFMMRNVGRLKLFSHGTNIEDAIDKKNLLLPEFTSSLLNVLGLSVSVHALDYDKFYKLNSLSILTNGFSIKESADILDRIDELKKKPAPKLGCLKCIADYFLGIPGIQDICYVSENLNKFSSVGIHRYGFSKFNPFDRDNPRGTFNILSLDYDKISMGDGHAIETGFTDRELGGKNIGSFNLNVNTDIRISSGKDYYLDSNTSKPDAKRSVSHVVTEKAWDDFPPTILTNGINGINKLWSATGGLVFEIEDGVIKILKILGDILSVDTGIYILNIMPKIEYIDMGYINELTEKIGKNITYVNKENSTYSLDLGFDFENMKDLLSKADFSKLKVIFSKDEYILKSYNGSYNISNKSGTYSSFGVSEFGPDITLTININKDYHNYSWKDNNLQYGKTHNFEDSFNLRWNFKESQSKQYFPDWEFKNEYIYNYSLGNGITKSDHVVDFSKYGYHEDNPAKILDNIFDPIPGESYIDISRNENVITSSSDSEWEDHLKGPGRNINQTTIIEAGKDILQTTTGKSGGDILQTITGKSGRDILQTIKYNGERFTSKEVTYESPINTNILVLNSDDYFIDKEHEELHSSNLIKTIMNGHNDEIDEKYDDYDVFRSNNIEVKQNDFPSNNILVNMGNSFESKSQSNTILVNNGNQLKNSNNSIIINNGEETTKSSNKLLINNGTSSTKSTNTIDVNNGNISNEILNKNENEINEISINCCPENMASSYRMNVSKLYDDDGPRYNAYITEYADVEKILTTRFIVENSEEHISWNNQQIINSASIIKFVSPKISEKFDILDKPIIKPHSGNFLNRFKEYNKNIFNTIKNVLNYMKNILLDEKE